MIERVDVSISQPVANGEPARRAAPSLAANRTWWTFGLFCLLLISANCLDMALTPVGVANGYLAKSDGRTISGAAVAHAAGEFRIVFANLLWMKVVDHYHHQFIASGHDWEKNQSELPLLRMITWLDPHFVEAYDVGEGVLMDLGRDNEAMSFLNEGIANNPRSWQLYNDKALYYAWYHKNPKDALPFAERARTVADDPFYKHRMDLFCHTLQRMSAQKAGKTASRRQGVNPTPRPPVKSHA